MLLSLRVRHLALIDSAEIEFGKGMHVLTGETGAGKSIVVDAVNLVLGGRADRDLIRTGEEKAWVEADFDISDCPAARELLMKHSIEDESGLVTLCREVSRSGRNLCRVCGVTMPLAFLREFGDALMDVYGQHENRFLMDESYHLGYLDASGDLEHERLMREVALAAEAFLAKHREYIRIARENSEKTLRVQELERALKELDAAALRAGEEEELCAARNRYRHAEKINESLTAACSALSEDASGGGGALEALRNAAESVRRLSEFGKPFNELASGLESVYYEADELSREMHTLLQSEDFDALKADQVEQRLDLIRRLERRYGGTLIEIIEQQKQMRVEYERLQGLEDEVSEKAAENRKLLQRYRQLAAELTVSRRRTADSFERDLKEQLHDLGMEKTEFRVEFARREEEKRRMPRPEGDDEIAFMISPNPGEPLKPLSRIASGGELSRLMLALKSLEAAHQGVPTMVFDEIDTGISGQMAQTVGEKMAALADRRQVICVTHLPQIAAMGDREYLVSKKETDGRTVTNVRLLDTRERIAEIARLVGGADGSASDSAVRHAEHLLREAHTKRSENCL